MKGCMCCVSRNARKRTSVYLRLCANLGSTSHFYSSNQIWLIGCLLVLSGWEPQCISIWPDYARLWELAIRFSTNSAVVSCSWTLLAQPQGSRKSWRLMMTRNCKHLHHGLIDAFFVLFSCLLGSFYCIERELHNIFHKRGGRYICFHRFHALPSN